MIIGIDASNIREGGGVTHLSELLNHTDVDTLKIDRIVVWASNSTLDKIVSAPWLEKRTHKVLNSSLFFRLLWSPFYQKREALGQQCNVLFVPGGSDVSGFKPMVSMSQNLLPFEWKELRRYGFTLMTFKGILLRFTQGKTFKRSSGIIFLTQYAHAAVMKSIGKIRGRSLIIPHGINPMFDNNPEFKEFRDSFSSNHPCRLLYVSGLLPYKHQDKVLEAVYSLKKQGYTLILDLVGPDGPLRKKVESVFSKYDQVKEYAYYRGKIDYTQLKELYQSADIGIFASSCETFGQILTESMNAGLPMACSNRSAMPEILENYGIYFDPESSESIAMAIRTLIDDHQLRRKMALQAYAKSKAYTWRNCSYETMKFLILCSKKNK